MTDLVTEHATFVIERTYPVEPARVFAAWSDPVSKTRWFSPPANWAKSEHDLDFSVGGREHLSVRPPGQPPHAFDARYHDIEKDRRIVFTYEMKVAGVTISVSVSTVEFAAAGDGTALRLTEQVVFLDGGDSLETREQGTRDLLDNLGAELRRSPSGS